MALTLTSWHMLIPRLSLLLWTSFFFRRFWKASLIALSIHISSFYSWNETQQTNQIHFFLISIGKRKKGLKYFVTERMVNLLNGQSHCVPFALSKAMTNWVWFHLGHTINAQRFLPFDRFFSSSSSFCSSDPSWFAWANVY